MREAIHELLRSDSFLSGIDFTVTIAEPGILEFSVPLTKNLLRPGEFMNGGAIMTVMDAAGGLCVMTYGDVSNEVTINMNTSFYRPVMTGPIRVRAEVVKRGRNVTFSEIKLYDGGGKLCAGATGSWYVMKGEEQWK